MTDFLSGLGSGLASGLLNLGASAISSSRSTKASKKLMLLQDFLNRRYTRDSYGLMREGLEKAGYNPLLALGSSANSSMPSATQGISDSDIGDQAINSAIAMRSANAEVKRIKAETEGIKTENEIKKKQLEKTTADNNFSPKVQLSKIMENPSGLSNYYQKVKNAVSGLGVQLPDLPVSSAKSSQNFNKKVIKLHDNKPYVQNGVPRSVVRNFSNSNPKIQQLSDKEVRVLSKKRYKGNYNKPPKGFIN